MGAGRDSQDVLRPSLAGQVLATSAALTTPSWVAQSLSVHCSAAALVGALMAFARL